MLTIQALKQFGANTDEGMARCINNEGLYLKLVKMVPDEKGFDQLIQALEENDLDKAFEAAHSLKGVLGNLSLTPMYNVCSEMTELLRARKDIDYSQYLSDLLALRDQLRALI